MTSPAPRLRHVVLLHFRDDASDADIQRVVDAFCALPQQIDLIQDFEWGINNSLEGINDGFTHCFLLTFASEADRDAYLPHPAHRAFGKVLGPVKERVLVVDYWAQTTTEE